MNENSKRSDKFGRALKKADLFGSTVTFKVGGGDAFNTVFGALISILIISVVIVYGQGKFQKMYLRLDTTF